MMIARRQCTCCEEVFVAVHLAPEEAAAVAKAIAAMPPDDRPAVFTEIAAGLANVEAAPA